MEKTKVIKNRDYKSLLDELKGIINGGRHQIYKAVDNIKVQTYWQIGERIVREEIKNKERAEYGDYLIKNLAIDLNTPKQRLSEIIRFYKCYPIVRTLSGQKNSSRIIKIQE